MQRRADDLMHLYHAPSPQNGQRTKGREICKDKNNLQGSFKINDKTGFQIISHRRNQVGKSTNLESGSEVFHSELKGQIESIGPLYSNDAKLRHMPPWRDQDVNMVSGSPIQRPYTDMPNKGRSEDRHISRDLRKETSSRKECARRHLMGFLFTRQPPIRRSNTFVAGERPTTDIHFPQLHRKEGQKASVRPSKTPEDEERPNGGRLRRTQSYKSAPAIAGNGVNSEKTSIDVLSPGRVRSNSTGAKLNLPELINDINNAVNSRNEMLTNNNNEDTYSVLEAINQDIIPLTNLDVFHELRKSGKFRPITPGLIAKLNKVRVSSKHRTEQWIRALPLDHRGTHIGEEYREHLNKSPPRDTTWIYEKKDCVENT